MLSVVRALERALTLSSISPHRRAMLQMCKWGKGFLKNTELLCRASMQGRNHCFQCLWLGLPLQHKSSCTSESMRGRDPVCVRSESGLHIHLTPRGRKPCRCRYVHISPFPREPVSTTILAAPREGSCVCFARHCVPSSWHSAWQE